MFIINIKYHLEIVLRRTTDVKCTAKCLKFQDSNHFNVLLLHRLNTIIKISIFSSSALPYLFFLFSSDIKLYPVIVVHGATAPLLLEWTDVSYVLKTMGLRA